MSINYVIATWAGQNGSICRNTLCDVYPHPKDYLRIHLKQLTKVKHNLSQVTVMMAHVADGVPKYMDYYNDLEESVEILKRNGTNVQFVSCPNFALSYGQYFEAFQKFSRNQTAVNQTAVNQTVVNQTAVVSPVNQVNQFDYYCFMEDDYTVGLDNFDKELKEIYKSKFPNNIGYLCSWAPVGIGKFHAAFEFGLISSKTLEKLYARYPDPKNQFIGLRHGDVQIKFSDLFLQSGIPIKDFSDIYATPYYKGVKKRLINCSKSPRRYQCLFFPLQMIMDYSEDAIKKLPLHGLVK